MLFFKQCPVSYNTPYEKIGDEVRSLTDKVPFDIPDSWEWVRLGTVIELESGQDLTPDKYNDCGKGIPYITGASNIENGNVLINRWTEYGRAFAYCGDVLLTCKGTVGTMAVLQEPQVHIARQIMAIRPISELYVPYIQLVLETLVEDLKAAAKSMIPGIAREDVLQSLFPVPPVSEQKRIVHKVSELSPCLEQYAAADTKLLSLNTGFPEALKKSILQEAVQGKLVPQDPTDEPAEALLERIRAKKQQLIKEGKIKKDKHESVIFRRDNSHYEKLDGVERCIDDELPFEIPENWLWQRIPTISLSISAGGDKPSVFSKVKTEECSVPVYSNGEKDDGLFGYTDVAKVFDKSVTISGRGTIGFSCVRNEPYVPIVRLITVVPCAGIDLQYLHFVFTALFEQGVGTSIQQLTVPMLQVKLIPVPPLVEQHRIVQRIEELLPLVKGL